MKKYWFASLIISMLVCAFAFSGCKFFYSTKLQAPKLNLNESDMIIYWDANYNASRYDIYMNSAKVDSIESDNNSTQYSYCYEDVVGEFGEFAFQVNSIGSGKYADSDISKAVTVKIGTASSFINKNVTDVKYEFDDNYDPTNIKINDNLLSWTAPSGV